MGKTSRIEWIDDPLDILGDKAMVVAMEELAELQQAISKGIRGKLDYENLCEEIADVEICIEWITRKYNIKDEDVCSWMDKKIARIVDRMDRGELK